MVHENTYIYIYTYIYIHIRSRRISTINSSKNLTLFVPAPSRQHPEAPGCSPWVTGGPKGDVFKVFPMGAWYGPLAPLQGSELWAPVLKVVNNCVIMALEGFRIRGPY